MKFTVAIVCSDDHSIAECLKSIQEDVSIIVVLNFPDDYVQMTCENDHRVSIIRHDERNLGKLRQMAADNCMTPGICYIDSDCVVHRDFVNIVEKELDHYYSIKIPMRYRYYNGRTKVVSECRKFTTPDTLLLMPFAFRLDIQKMIGKLFNENLSWGEDSDQRVRIGEKKVGCHISRAIVYHKALTIKEDARSAFRLGYGTFLQEQFLHTRKRSLFKDLSIFHELNAALKCFWMTSSFFAALYHLFVWRPAYKLGYWLKRRKQK